MCASLPALLPARFSPAVHCESGGFNIFRALCPGHLQLASGYAVGLRGGTLKCLRFRHICRQDVRTGLGVWGMEGWREEAAGRRRRRRRWRVSVGAPNVMWQWTTSLNSFQGSLGRSEQPVVARSLKSHFSSGNVSMFSIENQMWQASCVCVHTDRDPVHRKRRIMRLRWKGDFPNMCFLCWQGGVSAIMLINASHYSSIYAQNRKTSWVD